RTPWLAPDSKARQAAQSKALLRLPRAASRTVRTRPDASPAARFGTAVVGIGGAGSRVSHPGAGAGGSWHGPRYVPPQSCTDGGAITYPVAVFTSTPAPSRARVGPE